MSYETHYINGVDYTDLQTFRPSLSFGAVLQGLTVDGKWVEIGNIVFPSDLKENTMHPDVKPTWQGTIDALLGEYRVKYDEQIAFEHKHLVEGEIASAQIYANQAEEHFISIKTLRELIQRMEK